MPESENKIFGLLAEFDSPESLILAAERIRDAGYKNFDCHSPFPIHGLDKTMGMPRSRLGYVAGLFAIIGFIGAITLQWWTSTIDYPIVISGKPLFSYQAFVPVTFALAVLFSAISAVFGMLIFNKLPMFFHPLFSADRFRKVTDDGFFVSIEAADELFELEKTKAFLDSIGGTNIEKVFEG
jgi:hypothetical protein